jgi:4-methyl-5(b-hydroxyethyl)-thiazole monophosphate biosynthesis
VAAICAAPTVLGAQGILQGQRAICYPGMEEQLTGAEVVTEPVVCSGNITTSRGMGTAIPFALSLVAQLKGQQTADDLGRSIVWA